MGFFFQFTNVYTNVIPANALYIAVVQREYRIRCDFSITCIIKTILHSPCRIATRKMMMGIKLLCKKTKLQKRRGETMGDLAFCQEKHAQFSF